MRCIIVLASAIRAALRPLYMPGHVRADWLMPAAAFLLFPAIAVVGLFILFVVPNSRLQFTPLSWSRNLFKLSHPKQFFHLAAFVFMAQGLVLVLRQAVAGSGIGAEAIAVLSAGCGFWLGLRMLGFGFVCNRGAASDYSSQRTRCARR